MKIRTIEILLLVLFILLSFFYYTFDFGAGNTDKVFITITTFFFSIFTGFFITRQGNRYTKIREIISTFDGKMSSTYRVAGNISPIVQQKIGALIKDHYEKILDTKRWDYHFINKSNTISGVHNVLEEEVGGVKQESLRNQSIGRVLTNMGDCQVLRKNMVMIFQERIPGFQWFLICFFVLILLVAITVIPSHLFLLGSVLKSAFVISIISVIVILHNLDNLHLFENFIGENSAKDVIGIINGEK
ncbi:MAG: hypothetical protein NTZ44_04040 [Candidatus Nomurabacteria bacterium]|nr:hypothetical protein [Candidatus Nomurabacteria bacterium]